MLLMAIDHASMAFNGQRLVTDGAFLYAPGTELPAVQFYLRWITHLCAPTFLFLAGTSMALSLERQKLPQSDGTYHLAVRGLLVASLDPLYVSFFWVAGKFQFQVLYAIGVSMVALAFLRKLSIKVLLFTGIFLSLFSEMLLGVFIQQFGVSTFGGGLLLHGGSFGRLIVSYPLFPWLGIMILGWCFGRLLLSHPDATPRQQAARWAPRFAILCTVLFLGIRGANGFGNMRLYREGHSLIQWLHVSKYPPSASFITLELAGMFSILSLLFFLSGSSGAPKKVNAQGAAQKAPDIWDPLARFGQTAMFFYLLHIPLLEGMALAWGGRKTMGTQEALLAAGATCVILYPLCIWYRGFKKARPQSLLRYF